MARRITLRALQGETARYGKPVTGREAAILEAATRLFGKSGYKGTPTAKIAAAAGVTERTLFRYFPTKEALYRRVMFPALMSAAIPTELADTGKLFATDSETFPDWHRRILKLRLDVVRKAAPQFRLLLSTLFSDDSVRKETIELWRANLWTRAVDAVERYQKRGQVRSDLSAESIARAVISLNVSYIVARALIAPDGKWSDDEAIAATVDILLNGVAPR